ncbi:MAG: tetratricopeptide repeat protein [Phycisphaerales bacterium]|nr:tetratricopeptide repeat protein [Phycisphaerales bacterium]
MVMSIVGSLGRKALMMSLVSLAAGLAGCADIVTYSRDAQEQGLQYYDAGQYTDAAGAFNNAIKQAPDNYQARYYLGSSYARLGNYEKAILAYRTALDAMKVTYGGQRDTDFRNKIIDGLALAVAQSPNRLVEMDKIQADAGSRANAENYIILAKACQYAGDPDGAMESYNRAAMLAPNDFEVQKQSGLYLDSLGQPGAVGALSRANALNPEDQVVADALRRHNIIPGPSLKEPHELAKPIMPNGPIPDLGLGGNKLAQPAGSDQSSAPAPAPSATYPRD